MNPIFSDTAPVLFIGQTFVPLQTDEFIEQQGISSLVLIGNELAPMVNQFKQRYESRYSKKLIVTILIGRSPRQITQAGEIEALDVIRIPMPVLGVEVVHMSYNQLNSQLEVTYRNTQSAPVYFRTTISAGDLATGDVETIFLSGGKSRTFTYEIQLSSAETQGNILITYGEDRDSLDSIYTYPFESIPFLDIIDISSIDLVSASYDRFNNAIYIRIKNTGEVSLYADIEIDLMIDGVMQTIFAPSVYRLEEGEQRDIIFRQKLTSLDIADNPEVMVRAYFGQREIALTKTFEKQLPLGMSIPGYLYAAIASAILLILLLIIFFRKKKRH